MLDQACAHCPIFPTAASRRSLGRVSVPVWLVVLSDQLPIAGLVSLYPTNYLIGRRPLPRRLTALTQRPHAVLAPVSQRYPPPQDTFLRDTHPSATHRSPDAYDLHVLSMPPAFALSQDQTLRFISTIQPKSQTAPQPLDQAPLTTLDARYPPPNHMPHKQGTQPREQASTRFQKTDTIVNEHAAKRQRPNRSNQAGKQEAKEDKTSRNPNHPNQHQRPLNKHQSSTSTNPRHTRPTAHHPAHHQATHHHPATTEARK